MTKFVVALATLLFFVVTPAQARPAGCPSLWCGCWLCIDRGYSVAQCKALGLFKARNWAVHFQRAALMPGMVAVFARGRGSGGHVGRIVAVPGPGRVVMISGNDGRAVRTRERSTKGLIATVDPRSPRTEGKANAKRRPSKPDTEAQLADLSPS